VASLVQSAGNSASSSSSVTVTLSPTGGGNCLVVCAGGLAGSAPSVSGVTLGGSAGNFGVAPAKKQAVASFTDGDCEVWTDQNCAGGQTSVTVTFSGSQTDAYAWVMEWSGIAGTGAVDKTNSGSTTSSPSSSGSTGTLTNPAEVVIAASLAACVTSGTSQAGPALPWTNLAQVSAGDGTLIAGYQIVTANTALTYSATISGGNGVYMSAAVIVSLKLAPPSQASYPPLIPPGMASPMAFQRQAWPVPGPLVVLGSDTGTGTEAVTGSGQVGNPGYPLIPPGFGSPMAFQRRSPRVPSSLPTFASGDTGAGADTGTIRVTSADTGTGTDAGGISQEADTGTGTEASTITATVSAADTGSGADAGGIGGVQAGDTGSGTDGSGSVTVRELQMVRWSAPDKLSTSGGTMA
jgi:hypothetical protein